MVCPRPLPVHGWLVLGHYLIMDAQQIGSQSTHHSVTTVSMTSPLYPPAPGYCLRFWYNMYGRDVIDLHVYAKVRRYWTIV